MLTPEEYIQLKPRDAWLHAIDVLRHVLKGDTKQTCFRDPNDGVAGKACLAELRAALEKHSPDGAFDTVLEQHVITSPKRVARTSDSGDFDPDRYFAGDERCFEEWEKHDLPSGDGLTLLIDADISWAARGDSDMAKRHERAYRLCLQAEAEGVPCRVVASFCSEIREFRKYLHLFLIIKDWRDPIFPGIWGAMQSNLTCNALINTIMDYLVGTSTHGNGSPRPFDPAPYMLGEEFRVLEPRRNLIGGQPA